MLTIASRATAILLPAIFSLMFPWAANAEPATAWRVRTTGLDTDGKCTRRAFSALNSAGFNGAASGSIGVFGKDSTIALNVICMNSGAQVAIFCATDRAESWAQTVKACDTVARYMVP